MRSEETLYQRLYSVLLAPQGRLLHNGRGSVAVYLEGTRLRRNRTVAASKRTFPRSAGTRMKAEIRGDPP